MTLIQWKENMTVGVEVFDMQHQKLIDIICRLSLAVEEGKGQEILGEILDSLIDYTKVHFACEETQFERLGYKDSAIHKFEHDAYQKKVAGLKKRFDDGKLVLSGSILHYASDWWTHHIMVTDQMYSSFFNNQGLH